MAGQRGELGADESRARADGRGGDGHGGADDVEWEWGVERGGGAGRTKAEGDECEGFIEYVGGVRGGVRWSGREGNARGVFSRGCLVGLCYSS